MAVCNHSAKEICLKIVYCGIPKSGKTTNLNYIHNKLDPHFRGDLISKSCVENRCQTYESLTIKAGLIEGYKLSIELVTYHSSSLQDADGIVFVVDSAPERMVENLETLQFVRQDLEIKGQDPDSIPLLFQLNKRDLRSAASPEEIDGFLDVSEPSVLTCAQSGYQVFETLDIITEIVLNNFRVSAVMSRERNSEENIENSSNIALSS